VQSQKINDPDGNWEYENSWLPGSYYAAMTFRYPWQRMPTEFNFFPFGRKAWAAPHATDGLVLMYDVLHMSDNGAYAYSYLFGIAYATGVLSMLYVYLPALGVRQHTEPSWGRLKQGLREGLLLSTDHKPDADSSGDTDTRPHPPTGLAGSINAEAEQSTDGRLLHTCLSMSSATASSYAVAPLDGGAPPDAPSGCITVAASISASEGRNLLLRNALGKVVANLQLLSELGAADGATDVQVMDLFIDEG